MVDGFGTGTARDVQKPGEGELPTSGMTPNFLLPQWSDALTVTPETLANTVIQQMEQTHSSCVVVVQDQKPVGIFTERDLVRLMATRRSLTQLPISEVMTVSVVTLPLHLVSDTWDVFHQMQQQQIRHLPIVDAQGDLLGLITIQSLRETIQPTDLLKLRRVAEVMSSEVIHASSQGSLLELVQLMVQCNVSCVVITETNPSGDVIPIGILTERDIVRLQNQGMDPETTPIHQVMTTPLILLHPKDTLMQAYDLMSQHRIRRMVIRGDRGELVGIITQSNILYAIDPLEAYALIQVLQQQVTHLQERNLLLLQQSNRELERQVQRIHEQQQEKDRYDRLLTTTALYIRQSLRLEEILEATVTELRRILQCDRTLFYQILPDKSGYVVSESVVDMALSLSKTFVTDPCFQENCNAFGDGKAHAIHDVWHHPELADCHRQMLVTFQVRASLVVPILQGDRLWGLLIANQCYAPRNWRDSEIDFLTHLATHVSIAIQQAMLVEQLQTELQERQQAEFALQQLNADLERRVTDRTLALTVSNARLQTELAERARTEQALQESEARYRRIVETANEGIWVIDTAYQTTFANPKMAAMLGYTVAEMQGESIFRFMDTNAEAIARPSLELHELGTRKEQDFKFQRKDGSDLWVLISTTPILDTEGNPLGMLAMVVDMTERHRLEQMKIEFLSMISHELRNPLTAMKAGLGLLQTKVIDPASDKGEQMIQIVTRGAERLVRLVNELLDLERLESGTIRLEKRGYRALALINGAIEQMQVLANEVEVTLTTQTQDFDVVVDGDRILQVLINLVGNAIKFSPSGTTVCVGAEPDVRMPVPSVRFYVRDQGRGIPPEQLETIFERFQQVNTSDAREKRGTGLGLAIARHIVQGHGGRIWAESQVGQGSVFYFTVPMAP